MAPSPIPDPHFHRPVATHVVAIRTAAVSVRRGRHGVLEPLACLECGEDTDLHCPDQEAPARLLATCQECGCWHLLLVDPGDGSLLCELPGPATVRAAIAAAG